MNNIKDNTKDNTNDNIMNNIKESIKNKVQGSIKNNIKNATMPVNIIPKRVRLDIRQNFFSNRISQFGTRYVTTFKRE